MKNLFKIIFLLFAFYFLLVKPVHAVEINSQSELEKQTMETINNSVTGERIEDFQSNILVQKDGSIKVTETIKYFFDYPRHGIYRNIPFTKYDNGKRYDVAFKFDKVRDEKGKKYTLSTSKSGEQWVLKIGDPNRTIEGEHTYIISYEARGELGYFSDHDELYWNVTGTGWDVPIKKATATITLPQTLTTEQIKLLCYTGPNGSTKHNCTGSTDGTTATFTTTLFLNSSEGLTFVEGFPKGIVEVLKPEVFVPFFDRWYGKLTLLGILIAAFLWYIVLPVYLILKWYRHGRDPEVGIAVRATFDPPKVGKRFLTPAETGALIDETVNNRDIFSTIVDLARRGYIKITEPKNKEFHLLKDVPKKTRSASSGQELLPFEQTLYDGLFEDGEDVELKKVKIYTTTAAVQKELYSLLVKHGYFTENPNTIRAKYYVLGSLGLFTFNFVMAFIAFVFGRVMPRKTLLGAQTAKQAQGLKNFLTSQERQLNFQGEKQMLFEKLLPYAMAFGVEKQWAKRFADFDLKNPDWYEGTSSTHFNTIIFANSLSNSYSNFAVSSTPPSSSGSGFSGGSSGGGGGGGGGGSW
jgi:uncharacterized membrane protein